MRAQQLQAEALKQQGITQAVSLGLAGAGEVVSQQASSMQQLALAEAQAGVQTTEELLQQIDDEDEIFSLMNGVS